MARLPALGLALTIVVLLAQGPCSDAAVSNIATDWNAALRSALTTYNIRHQVGLRHFAFLHVAQIRSLAVNFRREWHLPQPLVVSVASHHVLSILYEDQQNTNFDRLISTQLAGYTRDQYLRALSLVRSVVKYILSDRFDDGSHLFANFTAAPAGSPPGQYQNAPNQVFYLFQQLGWTRPFWGPPAYANLVVNLYKPYGVYSAKFLADAQETHNVGGTTSPGNTQDTKDTADFWADGTGTSQHGGHWNIIAIQLLPSNLTLYETARILATINSLAYDANILTYFIKYNTAKFWRPITAFRQGWENFTADPTWTPYLNTPQHPEYPSGHSTTAGAFGAALQWFLKTDALNSVSIATEGKSQSGAALAPRTYTSIPQIVEEVNWSRVYAGLHFRKAVEDAAELSFSYVAQNIQKAYRKLG